jgi:hypothetical protein
MARPTSFPDAPAASSQKGPCVYLFAVLLIGIAAHPLVAADASADPQPCRTTPALTANDVSHRLAAKNNERSQHLLSFEGKRHYDLEYSGFPSTRGAEMNVDASYRAPGKKKLVVVSESGSKVILNHVLHRLLASEEESSSDDASRSAVAVTPENYRFSLRGCDAAGGRDLYVMDVQPLHDSRYLYRGTIWVDVQDFAVVRIEAEPAKNPSFWTKRSTIHHQYRKIGDFYLPSFNQTVTETRFGGRAVLTIRYDNYRLDSSGGKRIAEN